jgi:hypothetical protein
MSLCSCVAAGSTAANSDGVRPAEKEACFVLRTGTLSEGGAAAAEVEEEEGLGTPPGEDVGDDVAAIGVGDALVEAAAAAVLAAAA